MATTPQALSGFASAVEIDGTDMHTFGMSVLDVQNPMPRARRRRVEIAGRHGDDDYSDRYEARSITLSGSIIADTNAQLLSNLDELREWLRLRDDGRSFQVIFQNQSTRYWECKYQGELSVNTIDRKWSTARLANFRLRLRCVVPYAQKTTTTTETVTLSVLQNKLIDYAGNVPTPLHITLWPRVLPNILEAKAGDANEDNTLWTYANATGADNTSKELYGTNAVAVNRTAGGTFSAKIDVTSEIDTAKWYVFCGFCRDATSDKAKLVVDMTGASNLEANFTRESGVTIAYAFKKVGPSDMSGLSAIAFKIENDGTDSVMYIDGCAIYEITEDEYDDDDFWPFPYITDPSNDDYIEPENPDLWLHNGLNIHSFKNGEDVSVAFPSSSNVSIMTDPLGGADRCFAFSVPTGGSATHYGRKFFVTGGKIYKVSFDYLCIEYTGTGQLTTGFASFGENEYLPLNTELAVSFTGTTTAWATHQEKVTAPKAAQLMCFRFGQAATCGGIILVKNIMVEEETVVDSEYNSFVPINVKKCEYTGTLEEGDRLLLDFDRLTAKLHDWSENTTENDMGNVDTDRLMLTPSNNCLRLMDTRFGAGTAAGGTSAGFLKAIISYRERYL